MLYFGTTGFSYPDWVGVFYPAGMPRREWLPYYCREFNACELPSTFQELPPASAVAALVEKSVPGFLFTVKAHQGMTHQRGANDALFPAFRRCLSPLIESGKLGCVVAQFPFGFAWCRESLDYLQLVQERLRGLPLAVEFRHPSWRQPSAMACLLRLRLAWCYIPQDGPPPSGPVPAATVYIRLPAAEGAEAGALPPLPWLSWLQETAKSSQLTFVFAGNGRSGGAIITIRRLKQWLVQDAPEKRQGAELFPPRSGDCSS